MSWAFCFSSLKTGMTSCRRFSEPMTLMKNRLCLFFSIFKVQSQKVIQLKCVVQGRFYSEMLQQVQMTFFLLRLVCKKVNPLTFSSSV